MKANDVLDQVFGNYFSRHEVNLISRCNEIKTRDGKIWGRTAWEKIKKAGWVRLLSDGRSYERLCRSKIREMEAN